MSEIKFEIIKKVGVLSKSDSRWAKRANSQADTRTLEAEIDRLVYRMTEEEIGIVEGK